MNSEVFQYRDYVKAPDFVKSPFRYAGGKFYALKHILPFIDCVPHDEYREPFIGGGSVFFGKKKAKINIINDLDKDIVTMYRAFADTEVAEKVASMVQVEEATKERHSQMKAFIPGDFTEEAYKIYYLNRTSFCGIINNPAWGYKDGKSSPPQNWPAFIRSASNKLQGVEIHNEDFTEIVRMPAKGKKVLIYLDPPYFAADQKRAYTKSFLYEDHLRVLEALKKTDYLFCLSYDDVPEIRKMYSWAYIHEAKWLYNTANKRGESRDLGNELIITNYEVSIPKLFDLFYQE